MKRFSLNTKTSLVISFFFVVAASLLTLFQHWEMTHETWGYWFFARVFSETGHFVIPDRSPVYVLYLLFFRWLGYPTSVSLEYVVTTLITGVILVLFFRPYVGLVIGTIAVILWIPYMQISEPSVQKLAIDAILAGLIIRRTKLSRFRLALSYALFGTAWLLRSSYLVFLPLFAIWDLCSAFKRKKLNSPLRWGIHISSDWPVLLFVGFFVLVQTFQSPHPWNNVWGATTTWFPSDGKSFLRMLQNYNASYIMLRYGSYQDRDFYFTNKEVFGNARNLIEAYNVNPIFMRRVATEYFKVGIPMITTMTRIPTLLNLADTQVLMHVAIVLLIAIGALAIGKNSDVSIFVLSSLFMIAMTIVHMPKERYMVFLLPLFILGAGWYGRIVWVIISVPLRFFRKIIPSVFSNIGLRTAQGVLILVFSGGPMATNFSGVLTASWPALLRSIRMDVQEHSLKALQFRDTSIYFPPMAASYPQVLDISEKCRGVMSLEYSFFGAFTDLPLDTLHDIWEIPPFGDWGKSEYTGLTPDRIDCLFISKNLKYGVGSGTNSQLRYEHYIKPYEDYLVSQGATVHPIEGYGEAVVL